MLFSSLFRFRSRNTKAIRNTAFFWTCQCSNLGNFVSFIKVFRVSNINNTSVIIFFLLICSRLSSMFEIIKYFIDFFRKIEALLNLTPAFSNLILPSYFLRKICQSLIPVIVLSQSPQSVFLAIFPVSFPSHSFQLFFLVVLFPVFFFLVILHSYFSYFSVILPNHFSSVFPNYFFPDFSPSH